MSLNKKAIKKTAKRNLNVQRTLDGETKTLKDGVIADSSVKTPPFTGGSCGMAIGITKNMGDFNSLRIDVFASTPCEEDDIVETSEKLRDILNEVLEETLSEYE